MTDGDPGKHGAKPELTGLLEDWLTIWQSELAGLVQDREMQEALLRAGDGWTQQARAASRWLSAAQPGSFEPAQRPAGADAATGTAAAAAAPDGRDARIEQLVQRVAELERRVAGADPLPHDPVPDVPPARRGRRA